ncbi:MAG TPA: DUF3147 family protein [Labilithrix sp.]|jgi:hypothetical protein
MALELLLRFVLGGVIVSAFAAVGEMFEPKTFAGIFGAAPSVAIATLALAFAKHDAGYVRIEAKSMLLGSAALFVYGAVCVFAAKRRNVPVWAGASVAWVAWLAAAFALLFLARSLGVNV